MGVGEIMDTLSSMRQDHQGMCGKMNHDMPTSRRAGIHPSGQHAAAADSAEE